MGRVTVAGGKVGMEAPSAGILANDLAVGSIVKLIENGSPVEYLVVHKGRPSTLYDTSCDGLWLLRKEVLDVRVWDSSTTKYANSSINTWLNGTFFNQFGSVEKAAIKQVKIPYCVGGGSETVNSGANGLSVKAFLLGFFEIGESERNYNSQPVDSAKLDYFPLYYGIYSYPERVAYRNGIVYAWWTRSPSVGSTYDIFVVRPNGGIVTIGKSNTSCDGHSVGPRPCVIVPGTAIFDEETLVLKGVA